MTESFCGDETNTWDRHTVVEEFHATTFFLMAFGAPRFVYPNKTWQFTASRLRGIITQLNRRWVTAKCFCRFFSGFLGNPNSEKTSPMCLPPHNYQGSWFFPRYRLNQSSEWERAFKSSPLMAIDIAIDLTGAISVGDAVVHIWNRILYPVLQAAGKRFYRISCPIVWSMSLDQSLDKQCVRWKMLLFFRDYHFSIDSILRLGVYAVWSKHPVIENLI